MRLHAGYRWRNSAHPLLTGARMRWDSRDRAEFPAVVSSWQASPSRTRAGRGLRYTLEFTELRRETPGGPEAVRTSGYCAAAA
ncbi:hypothetical protein NKH77_40385 [Streptomyces sp. M19]